MAIDPFGGADSSRRSKDPTLPTSFVPHSCQTLNSQHLCDTGVIIRTDPGAWESTAFGEHSKYLNIRVTPEPEFKRSGYEWTLKAFPADLVSVTTASGRDGGEKTSQTTAAGSGATALSVITTNGGMSASD